MFYARMSSTRIFIISYGYIHKPIMTSLDNIYNVYLRKKDDPEFITNEAQVRGSLISPFLRDILGWNVEDPDEVRYEYHVAGKRADIIACIDGISKFVVELKSLNHTIFSNADFYKQAIQYADGKGLQYAIVTNFKEFVILNSQFEPRNGNWLSLEIQRYSVEQLRESLGLLTYFSKQSWLERNRTKADSVLNNKFIENYQKLRPLDERLLDLFISWRSSCMSWIKNSKPRLMEKYGEGYVEEEVQRYLNRIIFITNCEDRKIEDVKLREYIRAYKSSLQIEGHAITKGIKKIFDYYFSRYNSDLFEKGLADEFEFDDGITYKILADIKSPENDLPYDFSIISPDILGITYENFIGHIIQGRKNLKEVIDVEKRKQEGIYYTPPWVVEQIVTRTVNEYIRGKPLKELYEIKILDPACGSGTFLTAAFKALLTQVEQLEDRELDYEERKKLFLSCIYGVDKDDRACDIAKLNISLLLAEKNKKLPSLSNNIKVGDSLIPRGIDGYTKSEDWSDRFQKIFSRKNGGFDIIIGNPPYLSPKDFDDSSKYIEVLKEEYGELKDMYYLFIRLIDKMLLRKGGVWGFIVPNTFFTLSSYRDLRDMLRRRYQSTIIDLSPNVFKSAYVFNAIIIATKSEATQHQIQVAYLSRESTSKLEFTNLAYAELEKYPKMPIFVPSCSYEAVDRDILETSGKIYSEFEKALSNAKNHKKENERIDKHLSSLKPGDITLLGLLCVGSQGLVTGNNSKYLGVRPQTQKERAVIWSRFVDLLAQKSRNISRVNFTVEIAQEYYKIAEELKLRKKNPTLFGKRFLYRIVEDDNIRAYTSLTEKERNDGVEDNERAWILYFRGNDDGDIWKVKNSEYILWSQQNVEELKRSKTTNSRWQGNEYFFKPGFGWVDYFGGRVKGFYVEPTVYSKNVVKFHSELLKDEYLLGLLNSAYITIYVKNYITNTRTLQVNDGKLIPIKIPTSEQNETIVGCVKTIMSLKTDLEKAEDKNERQRLMEQVARNEGLIDDLVFEIYGFDKQNDGALMREIRERVHLTPLDSVN